MTAWSQGQFASHAHSGVAHGEIRSHQSTEINEKEMKVHVYYGYQRLAYMLLQVTNAHGSMSYVWAILHVAGFH